MKEYIKPICLFANVMISSLMITSIPKDEVDATEQGESAIPAPRHL